MGGIYKNGWNLQKIDGISEIVLESSEKVHGRKSVGKGRKSAGKGRNSAGNGRNYPELQSQQKDMSQVKWTEKKTLIDGISYRICLDKNLCPLKFQV